ncbi:MAG: phosphoribosyl transferase [Candidatus Liptonbacteria bacterium]|nr:phosphoribosyl transferase [Candidatus Liptonbacteria bacterium]
MRFRDRNEAGQKLATLLTEYKKNAVVYGLPRGGVVVAAQVARAFDLSLDLIITRKIGHPFNPEYAIAVVAEDGCTIRNESEVAQVDPDWFRRAVSAETTEAKRRREMYLGNRPRSKTNSKTAIIVDDGIATGLTLELAIQEVRHLGPERIVVAVPVAPRDAADRFARLADRFLAVEVPEVYQGAVGAYYENFEQVTDQEVIKLLH